jgi:hypothetical protein
VRNRRTLTKEGQKRDDSTRNFVHGLIIIKNGNRIMFFVLSYTYFVNV